MRSTAQLKRDLGKLKELFEVIPHFTEKHPHFWLLTNQEDMSQGAYGANYKVTSLLYDETTTLLPQSDKIKTVNCFAFRDGKRLVIPCDKIGTKLTYYSNLSGQDAWWSKENVNLLAMVHLKSTLQSSFDENSYQIKILNISQRI